MIILFLCCPPGSSYVFRIHNAVHSNSSIEIYYQVSFIFQIDRVCTVLERLLFEFVFCFEGLEKLDLGSHP